MTKIAIVCSECGSADVSTQQVTGYWNPHKQDWDYEHYERDMYCCHCGDNGGCEEIPFDPDRFKACDADFDVGDMVRFEADMLVYSDLVGSNHIPDKPELALAVVVEENETNKRAKSYGDLRDTVLVRLMTGELVEVWPRDIYKVEEK